MAKPIDQVKENIKRKFHSLFENRIGKMPDEKDHTETDPKVIPIHRKHFPSSLLFISYT